MGGLGLSPHSAGCGARVGQGARAEGSMEEEEEGFEERGQGGQRGP